MTWKVVQDDDIMLELFAGLLVLSAAVFFFGLLFGRRCVDFTSEVVSKDQDHVSLIKSTEEQRVPGVGIVSENDGRVVLETAQSAVRQRQWRGTWRRRVCFSEIQSPTCCCCVGEQSSRMFAQRRR